MIVDCVADFHSHYPELQGGDLLIIAGDLTFNDLPMQRLRFLEWLSEQKYQRKIFIAGNHDTSLIGQYFRKTRGDGVDYLCDSGTEFEWEEEFKNCVTIEGQYGTHKAKRKLKIWGSPWTKRFEGMNPHCMAFTVDTEEELGDKFELIPHDTDILITHSPARFILDKNEIGFHVGSAYLNRWLKYCGRPKLHVFGHIHEAYGQKEYFSGCQSINCSHVNHLYEPVNKPIRIEL